MAALTKENISRARRSAVILAFTAGAAALLGAAAAWFPACAGGRVRALCQRAIPSTAAFDPVTLTKGEYAPIARLSSGAGRYKADLAVSEPEIRAFSGSLGAAKANKGVFVTTSYFTKPAIDFAERHPFVLLGGKRGPDRAGPAQSRHLFKKNCR